MDRGFTSSAVAGPAGGRRTIPAELGETSDAGHWLRPEQRANREGGFECCEGARRTATGDARTDREATTSSSGSGLCWAVGSDADQQFHVERQPASRLPGCADGRERNRFLQLHLSGIFSNHAHAFTGGPELQRARHPEFASWCGSQRKSGAKIFFQRGRGGEVFLDPN